MTLLSIRQAYLAALLAVSRYTSAALQIAFPINSQLPPVAYISQPFEFTFALTTFTGITPSTTYSLTKPPSWLLLDGAARTLSGTPTTADIGAPQFELVASDSSGRIAASITLVVLQKRTVYPNIGNIQSQLATGGFVAAPATLLLRSQQRFSFSLSPDLFQGVTSSTIYYALTSDGSPLPSWLQFDTTDIRFSGYTPPLLTPNPPQQIYSFVLVASNVVGFREANVGFQISISDHILTFSTTSVDVSVTRGSTLQIPSLLKNITLDGVGIGRAQLASVDATVPSWLHLDDSDLSFVGDAPEDMADTTVSVLVSSQGSNTANLTINLKADTSQNTVQVSLGTVVASSGAYLSYQIQLPSATGTEKATNASGINLPTWLSFNATNSTLRGQIPSFTQPETLNLVFRFDNQSSIIEAHLVLSVNQTEGPSASANSTTRPTSVPTRPSTISPSAADGPSPLSGRKLIYLILAIAIPVLVICLIVCIGLLVIRRRKKKRREVFAQNNPDYFPPPSSHGAESRSTRLATEARPTHTSESAPPTSSGVPQIELSWARNSQKRTRNKLAKRPKTPHDSVVGSSWDDLIDFDVQSNDSLHPLPFTIFKDAEQSKNVENKLPSTLRSSRQRPRVQSNRVSQRTPHSRISKATSLGTAQAVGLTTRISGAGHGAGGNRLPLANDPRKSWQTTAGTIPMVDSRPSTVVLSSFPTPPSRGGIQAASHTMNDATKDNGRTKPTLRLVNSSSDWSNSFQAARQQYYTQRARDQLEGAMRFSNAGSRGSSLPDLLSRSETVARQLQHAGNGEVQSRVEEKQPYVASPKPHKSPSRTMATSQCLPKRYSGLDRNTSVASSHQFDSAISSTSSVWEDENLVADRDTVGDLHWHTEGQSSSERPSPRLPFDSYYEPHGVTSRDATGVHRPRLADRRKQIDVEDREFERSQRSHKGSLRFV